MHLPEGALGSGRLRGLRGDLGVLVDVVQGKLPPHVPEVVPERFEQLADHELGLAAVRALVVAVLDERHRGVIRAADVVALGVDVAREVHELLRGPDELAGPHGGWQVLDRPEDRPRQK